MTGISIQRAGRAFGEVTKKRAPSAFSACRDTSELEGNPKIIYIACKEWMKNNPIYTIKIPFFIE